MLLCPTAYCTTGPGSAITSKGNRSQLTVCLLPICEDLGELNMQLQGFARFSVIIRGLQAKGLVVLTQLVVVVLGITS